jgi:hypothetical protein
MWLYAVLLPLINAESFGVREGNSQSLIDATASSCQEQDTWSERSKKCVEKPWSDFLNCVEEKNEGACKNNDWVKEHCVDTCALEYADLITVLDEGVPHSSDIEGMECAPSPDRVNALAGLLPSLRCSDSMPFYLDESDEFSMSEIHTCYGLATGIPINNPDGGELHVDDHVDNDQAQHMADFHLLQQLRIHPMRTLDPNAASIHFTGITPALSYFCKHDHTPAALYKSDRCRELSKKEQHAERMKAATVKLEKLVKGLSSEVKRVYVIVSSYWASVECLTDPLVSLMESPVGKRRILFASSDLTWAQRNCNLYANFVTIPYVASYRMDDAARESGAASCAASARDIDFFFAGTFQRCGGHCDSNEGGLRGNVIRAMRSESNRSLIIDLLDVDLMYAQGADAQRESELYAQRMLRSRFCLVAAGDTKTSRRLFEALAAGCIPVYLGYFDGEPGGFSMGAPQPLANGANNMPFRSSVNWSSLVIFAGGMKCLNTNQRSVALSLGRMLSARSQSPEFEKEFEIECHRRREVYLRSLSYYKGGGVATALLTELYNSRVPDRVECPSS